MNVSAVNVGSSSILHALPLVTTRCQTERDVESREQQQQQQQHGRRQRDKDHRGKDEERKRQRHHYEFDKFMRRKDETKWGKGYCQDRAKKEGHHLGYSYCLDSGEKMGQEDREELSNRKERLRNKVSEKVSTTDKKMDTDVFKDAETMFQIAIKLCC